MREWEQEFKRYQLTPAPPRMQLQAYIRLYCTEKDEKYLQWFLHYYERKLNAIAMGFVHDYAMYGHFTDIKQTYMAEMLVLLNKYDLSRGVYFLTYLEESHIENAVHDYIRTMRTGFTVQSKKEYQKLRTAMAELTRLGGKLDVANLDTIAARIKDTPENTKEILEAGLRNTQFVEYYRKYADEEEDEEREEAASDSTSQTETLFFRMERAEKVMAAFEALDYREKAIVSARLGFCRDCYTTHYYDENDLDEDDRPKEKPIPKAYFADLALEYGISPEAVEGLYQRALKKIWKEIEPYI